MADTTGFFSRLGGWLKRTGAQPNGDLPLQGTIIDETTPDANASIHGGSGLAMRSTFLRPWAKRDAAIDNLQNGVQAMGELMNSIRDNLERTNERQDQLLEYLSHLPQALQQLPESARMQGETLKAIQRRMEQQSEEQSKLADILERISRADEMNGRTLDALKDRVNTLNEHDERISDNLNTVGSALHSVSRNSEATSAVLVQMRDNQTTRDGELERVLHKQGARFTTMLAIAIFLSISALVSVGVIGYLLLNNLPAK